MNVLALVLIPVLAAGGGVEKESARLAVGKDGRRIVEWAEAAASAGFSGSILAARGGKVIAAVGVGSADLRGKEPNTPATLFEIASASKQITAAAIMRLVDQEKLRLDDSMAEHLPDIPEDCRGITIRHLLQHTSGIPGTNSSGRGTNLEAVLPLFLKGGPVHEPGTHHEYWNQGYALLSEVIARASGEDYVDFCKEELFEPAGMTVSCFTGDRAPRKMEVAIGRSSRGEPRSALEHPYGEYGFQYRGMGGVVTNVWDLWRWDRALRGEELLEADSKAELFKPGLEDYALGWRVKRNDHGRLTQSHGGAVRGFVCDVRRFPEEDGCLFVLCNRDDVPVWYVSKGLEELLFGDSPTILTPPERLQEKLQKAVLGEYQDNRGNQLVIEAHGKVTRANLHWSPPDGPVTRAVLGLDEKGELVFYAWKSANEIELERRGKKPARSIRMDGREYQRTAGK